MNPIFYSVGTLMCAVHGSIADRISATLPIIPWLKNAKITTTMSWKSRLYDAYVSSGQASVEQRPSTAMDAQRIFAPRATYIRSVIARHLPQDRSARIVDLACGHGAFLHFLRTAGYANISGCDISAEQIELAHKFGISEARCRDIRSELQDMSPESIDAVIVMDILEHLEIDELFAVLDGIFMAMKTGGTLVAHVPNAEGLFGMRIRYGDLTHERAFGPRSAEQLLRTIGFNNVQCFEDRPKVHGVKSLVRRILWDTGTLPHRLLLLAETGKRDFVLSQNMLVTARK
jgi:SAM-dependent methyltransferase